MAQFTVEVKSTTGEFTNHSTHDSYRDAVDQADMVGGRVVGDMDAWRYAKSEQGFEGDFAEWQSQDDDERSGYEAGAQGVGTV